MSPPAAVGGVITGIGLQVGYQKVEVVILFRSHDHVDAFARSGQLTLGYGLAAGSVGGEWQSQSMYFTKVSGAYVGVALEGALLFPAHAENEEFYQAGGVEVERILNGNVEIPLIHLENVNALNNAVNQFAQGKNECKVRSNSSDDVLFAMQEQKEQYRLRKMGGFASKLGSVPDASHVSLLNASHVSLPNASHVSLPNASHVSLPNAPSRMNGFGSKTASMANPAQASFPPNVPRVSVRTLETINSDSIINSTTPRALGLAGRELLKSSLTITICLVFIQDHVVDEEENHIKYHNVISALEGDTATLLAGSLQDGLEPPLQDFVDVFIASQGRAGLVSKYVVRSAPQSPKRQGTSSE